MVEYHTDSERGNLLPPHGLLFQIKILKHLMIHSTHFIYGYKEGR